MNSLPLIIPGTSSPIIPVQNNQALSLSKNSASDPAASNGPSFAQFLQNALQQVNDLDQQAQDQTVKLVTGQTDDLHQVFIAGEKASLALQLTIQVRNKVLDAYQEIMRMNI